MEGTVNLVFLLAQLAKIIILAKAVQLVCTLILRLVTIALVSHAVQTILVSAVIRENI